MNRDEKQAAVAGISAELEGSSAVFAIDYRGISVPQAAELRGKLREGDATFSVVKNRLAKRATEGTEAAAALDDHLVGPTALTFVRGDAVVAAKAIAEFAKANGVLAYKGGIMDGSALAPEQFDAIARLPGIDALRGQLVGLVSSPLGGVVRTLNGLLAGLARQLGQVAERGLVGDAVAEAPEGEANGGPEAGGEQPAVAEADADAETTSEDVADETPEGGAGDAGAEPGDEKED